jgi:organic radical activating enzyme
MNTTEQEKLVYPEMHVKGARFSLYKNGEVWARTKDLPAELISTLRNKEDGSAWKPSHKNFNSLCKQFVRDGDVDHLIKQQEKISKERGMKRNAGVELFDALVEAQKDLVAAQVNARRAAKHDPKWEGVAEAIQPSIDKSRTALAKARGEKSHDQH